MERLFRGQQTTDNGVLRSSAKSDSPKFTGRMHPRGDVVSPTYIRCEWFHDFEDEACATSSTLSKRSMSAFLIWSTKSCVTPLPWALVRTDASRDGPELSHHTQGIGDRPALHDLH